LDLPLTNITVDPITLTTSEGEVLETTYKADVQKMSTGKLTP
jgi:hypothetical protein